MSQADTLQRIFERLNQIEDRLCPIDVIVGYNVCRPVPDFTQPEGRQYSEAFELTVKIPRAFEEILQLIITLVNRQDVDCGKRLEQDSVRILGFDGDLLTDEGVVNLSTFSSTSPPTTSPSPTST